jgi:hypothetical protein
MDRHVAYTGTMRNVYILVVKPEGKRPQGRSKHRRDYNRQLELIIKKQDVRFRTGFVWLRVESSGGYVYTVVKLGVL